MSKKKIKIWTFVLGGNHGQFYQAYGMKYVLNNFFFNYKVCHVFYNNHVAKEILSQLKSLNILKYVIMLFYWTKHFNFSLPSSKSDLVIFGSDTIWMYNHPIAPVDVSFFGKKEYNKNKIAYAPSIATTEYPEIVKKQNIRNYLNDFLWIGARDLGTKKFSLKYCNSKTSVNLVCDPSLFLKSAFDKKKTNNDNKLISIYSPKKKIILPIYNIIKNNGYDVQNFGYVNSISDYKTQFSFFYSPLEILNKIHNSSLMITTTFHGVMAGLITKKPLIIISNPLLMSRLQGPILDSINTNRFFNENDLNKCNWSQILEKFVFDDTNYPKIDNFIIKSKNILIDQIKCNIDKI